MSTVVEEVGEESNMCCEPETKKQNNVASVVVAQLVKRS